MLAPISGSRRDGKSSFRTLTRYLTEGRDPVTDEIVERGEHLLSSNVLSYETAAAEMRAVAFENPRVTDPVYHYQLCWRPGEQPSQAQWEEAAQKTIRDLGFGEHQFLVVAHDDREHFHVHVLINRVHPETYRAHYPAFSKRELDKSLREIEHKQGWKPSPGLYRWDAQLGRAIKNSREDMEAYREQRRPELGRVAQKVEHFNDVESLEAYAKGTPAKELRELLRHGDEDWQGVHGLLRKHGLVMEKAERGGYTVRAIDTKLRVKASSVFRDAFSGKASREKTEKQLGPWEPPKRHIALRDAEKTYPQEAPKRDPAQRAERREARAAERERLKKDYRDYKADAEKELKRYKERGREELRKLAADQRGRREQLRKLPLAGPARQVARSVLAAEAVRERAALKQRLMEQESQHKPKNYRAWVKERAAKGDRAAGSQWRGFVYKERRLARELGEEGLVLGSFAGVEEGRRVWGDMADLDTLRRHALLGELKSLQWTIDQRTGHVSYQIAGRQALLDAGQKILVLDNREATVLAGLEMALQKFGPRLEVTGSEKFKEAVAMTAAQHGLQVQFQDQNLQRMYEQAREQARSGQQREQQRELNRGFERGGKQKQRGDFER